MPFGYQGKILHVDLERLMTEVEEPDLAFYRTYPGGSALGLYYLLRHTPPGANPLGPENTLTLALSVLTGAPISGQSRVTATALSPLTGGAGDSQAGGFYPAEMKFSGYDAFVFHGQAENPVYLWCRDGAVELRDAGHLWGKDTGEVESLLKDELDDERIQILQTGIAGENKVRFAAMMNMANRANGRNGLGAVMGSKKLKAVVVRGSLRPETADPRGLKKLARWGGEEFPESDVYTMGLYGTSDITEVQSEDGGLPTRNWRSGSFEGAKALDGKTMAESILKKRDTCYACVIRCKRVVEVEGGDCRTDPRYGGPEYETMATFGSYQGSDNLRAVAKANELCNRYGMDTISCGAIVAWVADCCEQDLLTEEDLDGLSFGFDHPEEMLQLVENIAHRRGIGDVLAEGSARAAEIIGRGTEDLTVTVKKQEVPAHMPQVKRSLGLIYAVNPFGADHQSSEHDPSYAFYPERMEEIGLTDPQPDHVLNTEKVRFALTTQYLYSALDTFNTCQFVFGPSWHLFGPDQLVSMIHLVTGWEISIGEVLEVGQRRLNMLRACNAREGFTREDDRLPEKMFQGLRGGASDGVKLDAEEVEKAKDEYYRMAGWDPETGNPTRETLHALGLGWIID